MSYLRKCNWRRDLTKREETSCSPVLREKQQVQKSHDVLSTWEQKGVNWSRLSQLEGWAWEGLGFIPPKVGSSQNILSSSEE